MVASSAHELQTHEIARELFDLMTQLLLVTPRARRRAAGGDLKEIEFHTLSILQERGTLSVGDIQRLLGILPAQMSRVIRSLETRPMTLIACRINPRDKRKIDVTLTDAGRRAVSEYQTVRVHRIAELLLDLTDDEQHHLAHLLDRVQGLLERRVP